MNRSGRRGGDQKDSIRGNHLAFSGGVKVTHLSRSSGLRSDLSCRSITMGIGTVLLEGPSFSEGRHNRITIYSKRGAKGPEAIAASWKAHGDEALNNVDVEIKEY